jgi:hypothetical protein
MWLSYVRIKMSDELTAYPQPAGLEYRLHRIVVAQQQHTKSQGVSGILQIRVQLHTLTIG